MPTKVYSNPEELSKAAAQLFLDVALESVRTGGRFSVALSGGSSPRRTYELLASDLFKHQIPWQKTYIFWGDERFVPPDDPQNNARMAREALLDQVPVPADHIFPIPTSGKPDAAAESYALTLASFFGGNQPRFDLVFLGLGENGHTASLFPGSDVLDEQNRWVASVYLEDKEQYRLTLTAPVINHARNVALLVYGSSKAQVLQEVLEGSHRPKELPAQLVNLSKGNLLWLVDKDAATKLDIS